MIGNQAFHCLAVLIGLRPAMTQLSPNETALLLKLASKSSRIAEIGVFEGATSRRILEQMPSGGELYCVDPFFAGRLGLAYGLIISKSQIRRAARRDVTCTIVRKLSHDYAPTAPQDLDLIFIDADHSYDAVCRDWRDWSPKVKVGGLLALHDSQPIPGRCPETCGPVRLVKELGAKPDGFERVTTSDTLTVYQRSK